MDRVQEESIWLIQDEEINTQVSGSFQIRGKEIYNEPVRNLDSKRDMYGRG